MTMFTFVALFHMDLFFMFSSLVGNAADPCLFETCRIDEFKVTGSGSLDGFVSDTDSISVIV